MYSLIKHPYQQLTKQAFGINIVIFLSLLLSHKNQLFPLSVGVLIIVYLIMLALSKPRKALFLFAGIKLTFDTLWYIELPFAKTLNINLLGLILVPLLISLFNLKISNKSGISLVVMAFLYLLWTIMVRIFNGLTLDFEMIIRASSILFGLIIGLFLLREEKDFNYFIFLLFISTIIPVITSAIQILSGFFNITLFFYKSDTAGLFRPAGLYYDPATTSMVVILSIMSILYLLWSGLIQKCYVKFSYTLLFLGVLTIIAGATRSMIVTLSVIALSFSIIYSWRISNLIIIISMFIVAFYISKPYLDPVIIKTQRDIDRLSAVSDIYAIIDEPSARTIFTGRISLWQDIWARFKGSFLAQNFLGTGQYSNAHSSYFFLLLKIGLLGLFYYLIFNFVLLFGILKSSFTKNGRIIGLVSIMSILLIGFSCSVVTYTSFQYFCYAIAGFIYSQTKKI